MTETHTTTEAAIRKKITNQMYAEVLFSIVIVRNSSLYMQSMLFPSILLTSVALLGFYLPPDSGERVGLQITILLTFMVFLLTVGEMFPASTGPYLGIYFVLSMAQLGINILMTIIVLHLHFKPCIRTKSTWKSERPQWFTVAGHTFEGDSLIPVRTRRILQLFAKYFNIADEGAAWMNPISSKTIPDTTINCNYKSAATDENLEGDSTLQITSEIKAEFKDGKDTASKASHEEADINGAKTPIALKDPEVTIVPSKITKRKHHSIDSESLKSSTSPEKSRTKELQKIINGLRLDVQGVVNKEMHKKHEKDTDEEFEESIEKEQEEWKSVARAVDRLFFRIYLFLMFSSYITLGAVAIHKSLH